MPKLNKAEQEQAQKINKSLKASIKDGSWWGVMTGFGETYLAPFAVFLKATPLQISYLTSIPQVCAAILQLAAVKLTNKVNSRKKIVITTSLLQAFIWLAIVGIGYFTRNVWLLIILAAFYHIFGSIQSPAWSSWIGDLVPENKRGKYFGKRNRIIGFVSFASILTAGHILDRFSSLDTFLAFAIVFSCAFIGRIISCYYLTKQYEPEVKIREPKGDGFFTFIRKSHKHNFGKFTWYIVSMYFAFMLIGPLYVLYWLQHLGFSYLEYTAIISTAMITTFITIAYWGTHADYYGNKTVLDVSSKVLAITPILWYLLHFLNDNILLYALAIQMMSGFAHAGFNIATTNLMFDFVQPIKRVRLFAYFNALKGIAIFIGATIGGVLAGITFSNPTLITLFPIGILFVMILSMVIRILVNLFFGPKIAELKEGVHKPHFLHFVTTMPIQGIIFDGVVGMNRTLKRFKERLLRMEKSLDYLEEDYRKKTKNG